MNKQETLALFACGRRDWNDWAGSMADEKKALQDNGKWMIGPDLPDRPGPLTAHSEAWLKAASADFRGHCFKADADFGGFVFPGDALFSPAATDEPGETDDSGDRTGFARNARFIGAIFKGRAEFKDQTVAGNADFDGAAFERSAVFDGASFQQQAVFDGATFEHGASFSGVVVEGRAELEDVTFKGLAWFDDATFNGGATFRNSTFASLTRFKSSVFEGTTSFGSARFNHDARFDDATFTGTALFERAAFAGVAGFESAAFGANAEFEGATFGSAAMFERVQFKGDGEFAQATFSGNASFAHAVFEKEADFSASQAQRAFNMDYAVWFRLPDFTSAQFLLAPQLSDLRVPWKLVEPGSFRRSIFSYIEPEVASKYRALKRLAIQGHDHAQALKFYAGEMRSQRSLIGYDGERELTQVEDVQRAKPDEGDWRLPHNTAKYHDNAARLLNPKRQIWRLAKPSWWFNLLYGGVSDFGRSMMRPVLVWLLSVALMTLIYLGAHFDRAAQAGQSYKVGLSEWFAASIVGLSTPALKGLGEGDCSPGFTAFSIAIKNGLLGLVRDVGGRAAQDAICLFGARGTNAASGALLNGNVLPSTSGMISVWQTSHWLLSAVLIFLFLLALRNHFRLL